MNKQSFPFLMDVPNTPTISPIDEAIAALKARHRADREAHRIAFEQSASKEFERAEAARRTAWIDRYREGHYIPLKFPYQSLDRNGLYRVALSREERIPKLFEAGLHDEALYCLMSRNAANHKASFTDVKSWFAELGMDVEGPYLIVGSRNPNERSTVTTATTSTADVVHATGLSKVLAEVLTYSSMITTRFGKVEWVVPEDFDPSEY
jgi:hypothetical protein